MGERVARHADAKVRLVGLLAVDFHAGSVGLNLRGRGLAGLGRGQVAEQLLDLCDRVPADVATEADHHPPRPVPAVRIAKERVAVRRAYGLLASDDVPTERLVAIQELLVDAADEVAGR